MYEKSVDWPWPFSLVEFNLMEDHKRSSPFKHYYITNNQGLAILHTNNSHFVIIPIYRFLYPKVTSALIQVAQTLQISFQHDLEYVQERRDYPQSDLNSTGRDWARRVVFGNRYTRMMCELSDRLDETVCVASPIGQGHKKLCAVEDSKLLGSIIVCDPTINRLSF